ncbi:hypothetical protein [Actinoplanes sp. GCM10030250]|uniref:hypothetical protein n=1 Tax=Actinoplanes sp. GCM10030250 TaxID=3273376 RepID=UPI003621CC4A
MPAVRISLVPGHTQLAIECEDADVVPWTAGIWADGNAALDVRFAAALAWLCATPDPVSAAMAGLLAESAELSAEWIREVPWRSLLG